MFSGMHVCYDADVVLYVSEQSQAQDDLLSILSAYLDLYHPALSLGDHGSTREVIALHALDHITKFVAPDLYFHHIHRKSQKAKASSEKQRTSRACEGGLILASRGRSRSRFHPTFRTYSSPVPLIGTRLAQRINDAYAISGISNRKPLSFSI